MKKLILGLFSLFCLCVIMSLPLKAHATNTYVSLFVDCDGGTCHTTNSFDLISGENRALVGSTVSSVYNFDEDPTAIDKDFIGWYVYNKTNNTQIPGTGLLTTAQVNNYIIPNHNIKFVAQWTNRVGYPVKNITYAAFLNGVGDPCYDVKITLINNGISYSGYGFVSIPESIYNTWTGNIDVIWEPLNGHFIMADGKWDSQTFSYTSTLSSFKKEKSLYCSANTTNKGAEFISPRRKVHDWYYQASFVSPDVSVLSTKQAGQVISNSAIVPANYTVETEIYQSGSIYDSAVNAALSTYGTSNVVVVDMTLKDNSNTPVTQLSDYVDVRVDIPGNYTIQPGNTIIVYYLNDNGTLEKCETAYYSDDPNNRYVTFQTNHFSVYVLVESPIVVEKEPENQPEPTQKESTNSTKETEKETVDSTEENTEETIQATKEINENISNMQVPTKEQNDISKSEDNHPKHEPSFVFIVVAGLFLIIIAGLFIALKKNKNIK